MYVLHYKQQLCLNFHHVHVSNTLEGEKKKCLYQTLPLWSKWGHLPFFISQTAGQQCSSVQNCKSVLHVKNNMFCWWRHAVLLVVQHGVPGGLRWGKGETCRTSLEKSQYSSGVFRRFIHRSWFWRYKLVRKLVSKAKPAFGLIADLPRPLFPPWIHICKGKRGSAAPWCPQIQTAWDPLKILLFILHG